MWEFMKIGLAQMSMDSDMEANFLKSLEYMRSAAKQDVDLICFPEVQLSPFFAQCEKFYEQDYYTPSEEGFQVFDTSFGKIGIVVCFDRHYPESIRTEALRGAELIIIPTANTIEEPSELFQWEVRIQAFQNSVNIAMCNRVGIEDEMEFSGESIVTDFNGNICVVADGKEQLLITEIDLGAATETRKIKPYIWLRRSNLYE